jgi:hypothetical protein
MAQQKYRTLYSKISMELGHSSSTNLLFGTYCKKNHNKHISTILKIAKETNAKNRLQLKSKNLTSHQSKTPSYTTTFALHQPPAPKRCKIPV